jgi:hypothetical protein
MLMFPFVEETENEASRQLEQDKQVDQEKAEDKQEFTFIFGSKRVYVICTMASCYICKYLNS